MTMRNAETVAAGLATNELTVETPDGAMALYEATPDGAARGAVIVVQEAFGVNEHIVDVCDRCGLSEIEATPKPRPPIVEPAIDAIRAKHTVEQESVIPRFRIHPVRRQAGPFR